MSYASMMKPGRFVSSIEQIEMRLLFSTCFKRKQRRRRNLSSRHVAVVSGNMTGYVRQRRTDDKT